MAGYRCRSLCVEISTSSSCPIHGPLSSDSTELMITVVTGELV